jgi:Winged helix-turn-helix DNA-binding
MDSVTPTPHHMELAMRYGALMAENAMLLERLKSMQMKEETRRQRQREAAYRRRISAVAAPPPFNPEAEEPEVEVEPVPVPEEVAPPPLNPEAEDSPQSPSFVAQQLTAVSVDEEIRITSEIDVGTIKSPARSVSWRKGLKHHPSSIHPQLVLRYIRANPQLQLNAIADGIGLSYQKTKEMVRELKKQKIVTAA